MKSYNELITLTGYDNRLAYLQTNNVVGEETLGSYRRLCQIFYRSTEWLKVRDEIIVRDHGCDMAIISPYYEIEGNIIVHHINPITIDDLINRTYNLYNPNNLVCVSFDTHQKITYAPSFINKNIPKISYERHANDTCPWK